MKQTMMTVFYGTNAVSTDSKFQKGMRCETKVMIALHRTNVVYTDLFIGLIALHRTNADYADLFIGLVALPRTNAV